MKTRRAGRVAVITGVAPWERGIELVVRFGAEQWLVVRVPQGDASARAFRVGEAVVVDESAGWPRVAPRRLDGRV